MREGFRGVRWALGIGASMLAAVVNARAQETLPAIDIGHARGSEADQRAPSGAPSDNANSGAALIDAAADPAPNPKSTVTQHGIRILGGPAQASSYKTLDLLPSVLEDSADAYGLSFNRSITVRGVSDFFLSRTINGLPIQGIVGGADLFDLDDVASVDLYRGSLQANQGLGFSSAGGVLDLRLRAPNEKFGGTIRQGGGSNAFWRTFARVDSGLLPSGTAFFVSGSIADADKWKGEGDAWRRNVAVGVTQTLGDKVDIAVYGVHNDQKAYDYFPLNYAQARQVGQFAWLDYNTALNGASSVDNKYYLLNRKRYVNNAIFAEITYRIAPDQTLSFKPYYWRNEGYQLTNSGNGVRLWPINNYNLGGVAEYKKRFAWDGELLVGYWGQTSKPEPPPLGQKQYTAAGGALKFANWATLATTGNHEFYSPYLQYTQNWDRTIVSGGLRLHVQGAPSLQYYATAGLPDVSYSDVWSFAPQPNANATVAGRYFYEWLPNLGVRHQLSDEWSFNASYSRKTGRPDWGPQATAFSGAQAAFLKNGINLQNLMNRIRPETVDAVDFGLRYQSGSLTVVPTFFGFWTHKKEVLIFDPAVGQSYYQSNAATNGYGFELEAGWKATEQFTLSGSVTAASEVYKADIATGANSVMPIAGKQVPYTPKFQAKLAATYHDDGLELTPVIRYVGGRYGLADNSQWVSPYCVVDLTASYEFGTKFGLTPMTLSVGAMNLFDHRYIGAISVNETNLNTTSYYVAPPRTVFAGLSATF